MLCGYARPVFGRSILLERRGASSATFRDEPIDKPAALTVRAPLEIRRCTATAGPKTFCGLAMLAIPKTPESSSAEASAHAVRQPRRGAHEEARQGLQRSVWAHSSGLIRQSSPLLSKLVAREWWPHRCLRFTVRYPWHRHLLGMATALNPRGTCPTRLVQVMLTEAVRRSHVIRLCVYALSCGLSFHSRGPGGLSTCIVMREPCLCALEMLFRGLT